MHVQDPGYLSDPAAYLRGAVRELTKYDVAAGETTARRLMEIDHRAREIRIRPGLLFERFHALLGRATLFCAGGIDWASEFHLKPRLHVVPDISTLKRRKPAFTGHVECPNCHRVVGGGVN